MNKTIVVVDEKTLPCPSCGAVPSVSATWLKMQYDSDLRAIPYACKSCRYHYKVQLVTIPVPPPGSKKANKRGCKCPIIDNHYGDGLYDDPETGERQYIIAENCPLHGAAPERIYTFPAVPGIPTEEK